MLALSFSVLVMLVAFGIPQPAFSQETALAVGGTSVRFAELPKGIASFGAAEARIQRGSLTVSECLA